MSETEGNGRPAAQERPGGGGGGRTAERDGVPPEAFARSEAEPPPPPPKTPFYKRPMVLLIGGVLIIGGLVVGILWWLYARQYESTDDAFVEADVTQVSARVAEHVDKVYITDNQFVEQHAKLVDLDPRDLRSKAAEARAALLAAEKGVQQAKDNALSQEANVGQARAAERAAQTEYDRARSEQERFEHLSPQAVTQQQLINLRAATASAEANLAAAKQKTVWAEANLKAAQAQVEVAQAQVQQAQAALDDALLQLSYANIAAPVAGHITNRSVNPGDYVQIGQALLALVPQNVYVIANYKETQLDLMKPGQPADITVDAFPGHVFHGKVDSIQRGSGAAFSLLPPENATGNYVKVVQRVPVKITFDADGYSMGPGMSVVPRVKVR